MNFVVQKDLSTKPDAKHLNGSLCFLCFPCRTVGHRGWYLTREAGVRDLKNQDARTTGKAGPCDWLVGYTQSGLGSKEWAPSPAAPPTSDVTLEDSLYFSVSINGDTITSFTG